MVLQDFQEHIRCFNYDQTDHALIDRWKISSEESKEVVSRYHTVVFLLTGEIRFNFRDYPETVIRAGEFVFVPFAAKVRYKGVKDTEFLLLRMNQHIRFCESYGIEQLFMHDRTIVSSKDKVHSILRANEVIMNYIKSLSVFYDDGFKCRYYFDIKVREFFVLLRLYYPKEDLRRFFRMILSVDTSFIELVKINYAKYKTAQELAEALNYSPSGFAKKFKAVFGQPVYNWMKEQKAQDIYHEICTGKKTFKQIATEFGFSNSSHFCDFCKANFGNTPGKIRKKPLNGENAEKLG